MEISDWIGFIISSFIILFWVLRDLFSARKRTKVPESYREKEEQKDVLEDFLSALKQDMKEAQEIAKKPAAPKVQKHAPPTTRVVKDNFTYKADLDEERLKIPIEKRKYETDLGAEVFVHFDEPVGSVDLWLQEDAYALNAKKKESRINQKLSSLKSKRDLVVWQVLMGPPKALEHIDSHDYFKIS